MQCRAQGEKRLSQNKVLEFVLTAMAYSMFDRGYEADEVKAICERVDYVADSMVEDYVNFTDIRKVLKDEYNFTFNFND